MQSCGKAGKKKTLNIIILRFNSIPLLLRFSVLSPSPDWPWDVWWKSEIFQRGPHKQASRGTAAYVTLLSTGPACCRTDRASLCGLGTQCHITSASPLRCFVKRWLGAGRHATRSGRYYHSTSCRPVKVNVWLNAVQTKWTAAATL